MTLLAFQDVHFAYGRREVLRGIDLDVEPGAFVAVVGPNGAGKSTLLRLASGLLKPTSGAVLLRGESVASLDRRTAARTIAGVGTEEGGAPFPFTVENSVALGRHPWRGAFGAPSAEDEALVDDALERTGLTALRDRSLPLLSSGERQRARIARCLAQEGELLLLDEPTSHLDLGHRVRILSILRRRAKEKNQGVLAALHDLNLAAGIADRIVLLVDGRVRAEGPPADVLTAAAVADAFETPAHVLSHPDTGAPIIVPITEGE